MDQAQQGTTAMKIYGNWNMGNPRRVAIFLAEKRIEIPFEVVDLASGVHRSEPFVSKNPFSRVPVLEFDDGTCLSETIAICRYFEALHPDPPLFGTGPQEAAVVEMWERRIEFHLLGPVSHIFRNSHPAMKEMEVPQVPAWAEANKPRAMDFVALLDRELANRRYVAGDRYSVADITGMIAVDFMKPAKLAVPDTVINLKRWYADVSARPSAKA